VSGYIEDLSSRLPVIVVSILVKLFHPDLDLDLCSYRVSNFKH